MAKPILTKKKQTLPPVPECLKKALQGVTYWIGHRRCLFNHYPLGEAAMVAELCNLIFTHLHDDQSLQCEVQYSSLVAPGKLPSDLTERARVDLVIWKQHSEGNEIPQFLIEVKRGSATKSEIDKDLQRLASISAVLPKCRKILIVAAEAERPERFVNGEGQSITGKHPVPLNSNYIYRVRKTAKAIHAVREGNFDRAQFACLIEVLPKVSALKSNVKAAPTKG